MPALPLGARNGCCGMAGRPMIGSAVAGTPRNSATSKAGTDGIGPAPALAGTRKQAASAAAWQAARRKIIRDTGHTLTADMGNRPTVSMGETKWLVLLLALQLLHDRGLQTLQSAGADAALQLT